MDTDIHQEQVELDVERQHKAREYARIGRRLSLIGLGISAAGVLVLLLRPGQLAARYPAAAHMVGLAAGHRLVSTANSGLFFGNLPGL